MIIAECEVRITNVSFMNDFICSYDADPISR